MENKQQYITQNQVDKIYKEALKKESIIFNDCLVVAVKLKNGFIIVESSATINQNSLNENIARKICESKIKKKIWEYEAYNLNYQNYKNNRGE